MNGLSGAFAAKVLAHIPLEQWIPRANCCSWRAHRQHDLLGRLVKVHADAIPFIELSVVERADLRESELCELCMRALKVCAPPPFRTGTVHSPVPFKQGQARDRKYLARLLCEARLATAKQHAYRQPHVSTSHVERGQRYPDSGCFLDQSYFATKQATGTRAHQFTSTAA